MEVIRYIKSIIHYYKTRRALRRGEFLYDYLKVSLELSKDINFDYYMTREENNIAVINSAKYSLPLQSSRHIGQEGGDLIRNTFTIRIKMWYKK